MKPKGKGRREVLRGMGAVMLGLTARPARAQSGEPPLKVIDFHNHYLGPGFTGIAGGGSPNPAARAYFEAVNRNLTSPNALLDSIDTAGVAARVVTTPIEFIQDPEGDVAPDMIARINDQLAEFVVRNPGRVHGLATVDPFSGDAGAREAVRAVRELGLRGLFVQAARKDLLLDSPRARPTLAAAASLGVPVFVHPITDSQLRGRLGRFGRPGVALNRSTINAAALISLLEGGTLDELPNLRVVVTTLAIGAILLAGALDNDRRIRRDAPELSRRHIYIDTMGLSPVLIRAALDVLGPERLLAGTDWPIFVEKQIPERLQRALELAGLEPADQQRVAHRNAAALLDIG
jgi:aminocarboxymuconate-semialdehyde decarboxylase